MTATLTATDRFANAVNNTDPTILETIMVHRNGLDGSRWLRPTTLDGLKAMTWEEIELKDFGPGVTVLCTQWPGYIGYEPINKLPPTKGLVLQLSPRAKLSDDLTLVFPGGVPITEDNYTYVLLFNSRGKEKIKNIVVGRPPDPSEVLTISNKAPFYDGFRLTAAYATTFGLTHYKCGSSFPRDIPAEQVIGKQQPGCVLRRIRLEDTVVITHEMYVWAASEDAAVALFLSDYRQRREQIAPTLKEENGRRPIYAGVPVTPTEVEIVKLPNTPSR